MKDIGIIFDHLEPSQAAYTAIFHMNKYLDVHYNQSACIFCAHLGPQCITPAFAVYHTGRICSFTGTLIAYSPSTTEQLYRGVRAKHKLRYIYDINNLDKSINDPSIYKFTRCENYIDILQKNTEIQSLSNTTVPSFEIDKIQSVIKELQ